MKYYCKNCGSVFEPGIVLNWNTPCIDWTCPMCGDYGTVVEIPDYETPEQRKKRTGKAYSDNGLVFFRRQEYVPGTNFNKMKWGEWEFFTYKNAREILERCVNLGKFCEIVIADPLVPPPNDWRPEEV